MLDSEISERFSILEVVLKEIQEGNVVGGHSHHNLVLLLEALETLNGSLDFLVFDVVD